MMDTNILEVKNLRKEYKNFILKDISFNLPKGFIMGLIGQNGAGKTTTIKLLMNLIKADGGQVKIFDLDYKNNEKEIKNRIGYVGEEQIFYQDMSVTWTENFFSRFYDSWDRNKFYELLDRFNINRSKKIKELSKGMKVKLAIALALSHNPDLLILDEPTSSLDPVIRREILDILQEFIQDENKSVLFSSHITEDLERIADYVTYIFEGRVVLTAEKEQLLSNWKKVHLKSGVGTENIKKYLTNIQENAFGISGVVKDYSKVKDTIEKILDKGDVKLENVSLDDVLLTLVKEGE